jgi:hypothetical protein
MNSREVVVLGAVVLIVLMGGFLFVTLAWGVGGMGFGMMGPNMMGPRTTGSIGVLELLICLVPVGLIALLVLGAGVVWLIRQNDSGSTQAWSSLPAQDTGVDTCPSCGRSVESDWQVCPYCGTPLQEDTV